VQPVPTQPDPTVGTEDLQPSPPTTGGEKGSLSPTPASTLPQPALVIQLQERVRVLRRALSAVRNELLYEKYVGKQHVRRCRRLHKEAKAVEDARAEAASCREESEILRQELFSAKEELGGERRAAQICHAGAAQSHNRIKAALVTSEERLSSLETEKRSLLASSQALSARLSASLLQNQVGAGSSLLEEMHRSTLDKMRGEREHLATAVEEQGFHLSAWEMHHSQQELEKEQEQQRRLTMERTSQAQAVMLEEATRQLHQGRLGSASLQDRCHSLEADKKRLEEDVTKLTTLLEDQKLASSAHEASLAQKYATLKRVVAHLEAECLSLHARLEVGETRIGSPSSTKQRSGEADSRGARPSGEKQVAEQNSMPLARLITPHAPSTPLLAAAGGSLRLHSTLPPDLERIRTGAQDSF